MSGKLEVNHDMETIKIFVSMVCILTYCMMVNRLYLISYLDRSWIKS